MKKYLKTILAISLLVILTISIVVLDAVGADFAVGKSTLYLGILYALTTLVYVFRCYARGYSPAIIFCSIGLALATTLLAGYFVIGGMSVVWPLIFTFFTFTLLGSYIFVSKSRFVLRSSIYSILMVVLLMIGTTISWIIAVGGLVLLVISVVLIERNANYSDGYEIPRVSIKEYTKED